MRYLLVSMSQTKQSFISMLNVSCWFGTTASEINVFEVTCAVKSLKTILFLYMGNFLLLTFMILSTELRLSRTTTSYSSKTVTNVSSKI